MTEIKILESTFKDLLDLLKGNFDLIFAKTSKTEKQEEIIKNYLLTFNKKENVFKIFNFEEKNYSTIHQEEIEKLFLFYKEEQIKYKKQSGFCIYGNIKIPMIKFEIFFKKRKRYLFQKEIDIDLDILKNKKNNFVVFIEKQHPNSLFFYNKKIDGEVIDIIEIDNLNKEISAFIFCKKNEDKKSFNSLSSYFKYFDKITYICFDEEIKKKQIPNFFGIYFINGKIHLFQEAKKIENKNSIINLSSAIQLYKISKNNNIKTLIDNFNENEKYEIYFEKIYEEIKRNNHNNTKKQK